MTISVAVAPRSRPSRPPHACRARPRRTQSRRGAGHVSVGIRMPRPCRDSVIVPGKAPSRQLARPSEDDILTRIATGGDSSPPIETPDSEKNDAISGESMTIALCSWRRKRIPVVAGYHAELSFKTRPVVEEFDGRGGHHADSSFRPQLRREVLARRGVRS